MLSKSECVALLRRQFQLIEATNPFSYAMQAEPNIFDCPYFPHIKRILDENPYVKVSLIGTGKQLKRYVLL